MDYNLKTSNRFFNVFVLVSQIKSDLVRYFFQNSFDFVSLVV